MQDCAIKKDLLYCYDYVHSFSKDIKISDCSDLTFLLENLVKKDFCNPLLFILRLHLFAIYVANTVFLAMMRIIIQQMMICQKRIFLI